ASVFGMYGVDTDWIFFLTHGNQFRARLDQLGFTLGNDTIKGTFGFDNPYSFGDMLQTYTGTANGGTFGAEMADTQYAKFIPNISMGIGYTSSLIGVGVGYSISFGDMIRKYNGKASVLLGHTPVLVLNALDNALRIAVPIQVVAFNDKYENGNTTKRTSVSLDSQIRYYTGLDMLPQVRLYLRYGNYSTESKESDVTTKQKAETFGFDFRLFFGSIVEEVALNPIIKVKFDTALGKNHTNTSIQAITILKDNSKTPSILEENATKYDKNPYQLMITPALGLTANSDIVSLYLEPSLGLKVNGSTSKNTKDSISLAYGVYGEIYVTPLKNLEWYFEAEIGNLGSSGSVNIGTEESPNNKNVSVSSKNYLGFNAATGITWYLPAL
uniref:cell surface protein n=1 Tax=Brachyspira sp. TaxID=1977261 RepID=UPI003D7EB90F